MTIDAHRQSAAVLVAKPSADGWDINAGFDAGGGEEVAEVVVGEMRITEVPTCGGQVFLSAVDLAGAAGAGRKNRWEGVGAQVFELTLGSLRPSWRPWRVLLASRTPSTAAEDPRLHARRRPSGDSPRAFHNPIMGCSMRGTGVHAIFDSHPVGPLRRKLTHRIIMKIIAAIGATCLGIVIGWLVRYFIRRLNKFSPMVLGSLVSIVLGGAVIKFLEADKTVWWFYPIGLFLGFVIYHLVVVFSERSSPSGKSSPSTPRKNWMSEPKFYK